jgi:hypothetical protein
MDTAAGKFPGSFLIITLGSPEGKVLGDEVTKVCHKFLGPIKELLGKGFRHRGIPERNHDCIGNLGVDVDDLAG